MKLESDTLRTLIASSYVRDGNADLAGLHGSGEIARDDIARAVLLDSGERRRRGLLVSVSTYTDLLEQYPGDDRLLESVVEQALESLVIDHGLVLETALRVVEAALPDQQDLVRRVALLHERLQDYAERGAEEAGPPPFLELPVAVGPSDVDGRPRYELRDVIGTGSQGWVYAASDRVLSEPGRAAMVAFKVIERDAEDRGDASGRLEAGLAREIRHEHVVRVYDVGAFEHAGRSFWYIAYELVEGETLVTRIASHDAETGPDTRKGSTLEVREAVRLLVPIVHAVATAHSLGVVHRDIKPNNVLVDRFGHARLTDFGLATRTTRERIGPSEDRAAGSLGFCAPEQFENRAYEATPLVDVYSLGGLLTWALTGRCPNGESVPEAIEFLGQYPKSPRTAIERDLRKACGPVLSSIVLRAIDPEVTRRYRSAAELAADLEAWLERRPVAWIHRSWAARTWLSVRRRPLTTLGVAFLAAGLGTSLVWGGYQGSVRELEVLEERMAGQKAVIDAVKVQHTIASSVVDVSFDGRPTPDLLPAVTMMESVFTPLVLSVDSSGRSLWDKRIAVVQKLLADSTSGGYHERLWEVALSVWLYRAGEHEEAIPHLDHSLAWLYEEFGERDRMFMTLRAVNELNRYRLGRSDAAQLDEVVTSMEAGTYDMPMWVREDIERAMRGD